MVKLKLSGDPKIKEQVTKTGKNNQQKTIIDTSTAKMLHYWFVCKHSLGVTQ